MRAMSPTTTLFVGLLQLIRDGGKSAVASEAVVRIAAIYRIERELATLGVDDRLAERQRRCTPLWESLQAWLTLERRRVPDGSATAKAIEYSLNSWSALTRSIGRATSMVTSWCGSRSAGACTSTTPCPADGAPRVGQSRPCSRAAWTAACRLPTPSLR